MSLVNAPCYPAVLPTSGLALGCSLPTVNITYPSVIHVVCDDDVEDCSDRATSSAGGIVQDEVWNLNPAAPQQSTMQKGRWTTKSGAVHGIVFDNLRTPRVYQDSSGRWYVRYSNSPTGNVYIDEVIPTFKATYTRQSELALVLPIPTLKALHLHFLTNTLALRERPKQVCLQGFLEVAMNGKLLIVVD